MPAFDKDKLFWPIFFSLIVFSVGASFYRFVIARDYAIVAHLPCNPSQESCFIEVCEEDDPECEEPAFEDKYYKAFSRKAKNIPDCDPEDESCPAFVCPEGEEECSIETCSVGGEEACSDAAVYAQELAAFEAEQATAEEETAETTEETSETASSSEEAIEAESSVIAEPTIETPEATVPLGTEVPTEAMPSDEPTSVGEYGDRAEPEASNQE